MYCQDYDEQLPAAREWCTVTQPYVRDWGLFRCPSFDKPFGFAFNASLDRLRLGRVDLPAEAVALFDSSAGRANATDAGQSLCRPPRHPEGNSIAYLDGHVKAGDPPQGFSVTPASARPPSSHPGP